MQKIWRETMQTNNNWFIKQRKKRIYKLHKKEYNLHEYQWLDAISGIKFFSFNQRRRISKRINTFNINPR